MKFNSYFKLDLGMCRILPLSELILNNSRNNICLSEYVQHECTDGFLLQLAINIVVVHIICCIYSNKRTILSTYGQDVSWQQHVN